MTRRPRRDDVHGRSAVAGDCGLNSPVFTCRLPFSYLGGSSSSLVASCDDCVLRKTLLIPESWELESKWLEAMRLWCEQMPCLKKQKMLGLASARDFVPISGVLRVSYRRCSLLFGNVAYLLSLLFRESFDFDIWLIETMS